MLIDYSWTCWIGNPKAKNRRAKKEGSLGVRMYIMEDNEDLLKVILSYRDYYGNHHDHKEKVIYATTGLFLPILAAL